MANNNMLAISQLNRDLVADFGYRTTDFGFVANNEKGSIHIIFGSVSPSGLLAGVPDGSIFFDVVAGKVWQKKNANATQGVGAGTSGTWVSQTLS